MYHLIGGDGNEYGPVSREQLLAWVREGRADQNTPVRPVNGTQWQPLGSYPELIAPPSPPPIIMPQPAAAAAPRSGATPHVPNYLVQSILVTLCCCIPLGILAIVFAAQVNTKLANGDVAGAQESSRKAKLWCWIAFGLGLATSVLWGAFALLDGLLESSEF